MLNHMKLAISVVTAIILFGCKSGSPDAPAAGNANNSPEGKTTIIKPGPNASDEALAAFVSAGPGDVIEFDCGFFDIDTTLLLSHTEDVTVKGCGREKTVLSFKDNNAPEGILVDTARGVWISDLTIADTDGNGFELRSVDHAKLERVRAFWSSDGGRFSPDPIAEEDVDEDGSYTSALTVNCTEPPMNDPNSEQGVGTATPDYVPSQNAGRYGIYPVKSRNVHVTDAESVGASDAGIYIGQSSNVIIEKSRAVYNVFGFEIENVQVGVYQDNLAECNTGGFLVYDLDGLTQYGSNTIVRRNTSINNNTYNFTEGGIVASIPRGTGMLTLSYDRIDVYDNVFQDNSTGGLIHVSYELLPEGGGRPAEQKIDWYTEGMVVRDNVFKNNGYSLPTATVAELQSNDLAKLLPALIGLKNQAAGDQYRGAHLVWDGLMDEKADCPYPKTNSGEDVPESPFHDGKPDYKGEHPEPSCRYNAYKFDESGERLKPEWWFSCIEDSNSYSDDSLKYTNFRGTKGANAVIAASGGDPSVVLDPDFVAGGAAELQEFPAVFDMTPHDCSQYTDTAQFEDLPEVTMPPFERTGEFDQGVNGDADELCSAIPTEGEVNFAAATVNCPFLHQYNLFDDEEDPRSEPNSDGVPFVMNSKLFSDYAVKYRVAYIPPGEKATYRDSGNGSTPNSAIVFPVGTIIAKTFAFLDEPNSAETIVETRLLIKRATSSGQPVWAGLPYIWETDGAGNRVAKLQLTGGSTAAAWNYTDADTGGNHTGNTDLYSIPNTSQCRTCHANKDAEGGAAPIGLKIRNMNHVYASESSMNTYQGNEHPIVGQNQIKYWCDTIMAGCPEITVTDGIADVERNPKFNVVGDSGLSGDADIEARARAWLEVNCMHCHNVRGFAENTGFYLDVFRQVDNSHGICKGVTAAGAEGTGGRHFDIVPADPDNSVLEFRISEAATAPAAKMPPIARSVVDVEGHALIEQWIRDVIVADEEKYPGSTNCAGGS